MCIRDRPNLGPYVTLKLSLENSKEASLDTLVLQSCNGVTFYFHFWATLFIVVFFTISFIYKIFTQAPEISNSLIGILAILLFHFISRIGNKLATKALINKVESLMRHNKIKFKFQQESM